MERWKRAVSIHAYGLVTSLLFRAHTPPEVMRARFARVAPGRAALQRKHPGLAFEDHALGSLHLEAVRATESPRRAIVHLHGGAFVFGSAATYRNRSMRLSYRCDAEVFVPDYRLAPEHPYPAALQDALVAIQYVRALRPALPLFISGDSAGGGLALSALLQLRDGGLPLPAGAILLSPWTDLSVSGASVDEKQGRDRWFTRAHLEQWASYYAGTVPRRQPLLSPVFADLRGLPPLLVLAGEDELLLDDARRVVTNAVRVGVDARLLASPGMQHNWPLTMPWLEASRSAWQNVVDFVERV
jgi:monoterpene epsilon-lactone hydrolase